MTRPESSAKTAVMTPNGQLADDGPRSHGVRSTPTVTGMVDWKTIAPATFPSAMTSLLSRVQMRLFAASGSSVASGARISDSRSGLKPSACETSPTKSAKNRAPTKIAANAMSVCARTSQSGGAFGRIDATARRRYVANVSSSKASASSFASSMSSGPLAGVRSTTKR